MGQGATGVGSATRIHLNYTEDVLMEKKYLVYRLVNGQIHAEIQYGEKLDRIEGQESELKRVELLDHNKYPISVLTKMYPYWKD